mmetsp:Transcript_127359/g.254425  ORF Transcript_127359/g.254425 Transcript_127359/m.254425 type:complete len:710 (-) Transcript_127359:55-2184(-)
MARASPSGCRTLRSTPSPSRSRGGENIREYEPLDSPDIADWQPAQDEPRLCSARPEAVRCLLGAAAVALLVALTVTAAATQTPWRPRISSGAAPMQEQALGPAGESLHEEKDGEDEARNVGLAEIIMTSNLSAATNSTSSTTTTTTTSPNKTCKTAAFNTECYNRVLWVMRDGVLQHPKWYPNLTVTSSFEEVQALLHEKNECNCDMPCAEAIDPSTVTGPMQPPVPFPHVEQGTLASLFEQVADSIVTQMAHTGGPLLCNPAIKLASQAVEAATKFLHPSDKPLHKWELSDSTMSECFDALEAKEAVKAEDRKYNRNWCWVGLKEFGCHRHFYDHLSWRKMQDLAVEAGVTSNYTFHPLKNPRICDNSIFGGTRAWTESDWRIAKQWFEDHVSVKVLSLATSVVRRATMRSTLSALDIPFEFVDGVDMRTDGAFEAAVGEGLIPGSFNVTKAQAEAYRARENMGTSGSIMGTVGCASGHFRAQLRGVKHKPMYLTLIFEDDVSPEADFIPKLWRLITVEMPCDWQAVSLYSRCPFGECVSPHLTRVQPDVNEPSWRCRHGVNYGFQGMAYRTTEITALQRLWKPVVFDEKRPHCLDVDVALASISDRVRFYAVPASQSPGLLKEISMGSSRVDINFQKQTPVNMQAPAPVATVPAKQSPTFCGNRQGADGCGKDGRATGWCSLTPRNCQKCAGQWCDKSATIVRWVGH